LKVISLVNNSTIIDCTHAYRSWQENDWTYTSCELSNGDTVESLFKKIEDGILSGQLSIAEYDTYFGVPKEIYIKGLETNLQDLATGYFTTIEFSYPVP
jgi:hypothetical protein